jgi:hypothetical protein
MQSDLSSTSSSNINKESNNTLYIFLTIVGIIVLCIYTNSKKENMTGGTLTQLFANDSQDTYLKSNVDNLATGQFDLYWNQPTRIANTFLNRGSPLPVGNSVPSLNIIQPSSNNMSDNIIIDDIVNVNEETIENNDLYDNSPSDMINQINKMNEINQMNSNTMDVMKVVSGCSKCKNKCNGTCNKPKPCVEKCRTNPSSCGGGAGGYRLETGFIEASRLPASQKIEEKIVYPDSYVGSYFINPIPDIAQPYPVILDRV